jgi:hypothetical protein
MNVRLLPATGSNHRSARKLPQTEARGRVTCSDHFTVNPSTNAAHSASSVSR